MIPIIIKTTVLQTTKRESLDSLTYGDVRDRNFSFKRNSSYSILNSFRKESTFSRDFCFHYLLAIFVHVKIKEPRLGSTRTDGCKE